MLLAWPCLVTQLFPALGSFWRDKVGGFLFGLFSYFKLPTQEELESRSQEPPASPVAGLVVQG